MTITKNIFYFIILISIALPNTGIAGDTKTLEDSLKLDLHDTLKGKILGKLAWSFSFGDSKKAYQLARKELLIGKEFHKDHLILDAYRTLGLSSVINDKAELGLAYYDSCLALAYKTKNDHFLCRCYSLMGGLYSDRSQFEKSIDVYAKALKHAEKSKDENLISMVRNNLADMYMVSNYQIEKAEALFLSSLATNERSKNWSAAAINAANLSEFYALVNNRKKADEYFDIAYQYIQRDTTKGFGYGTVHNAMANILYKKKDYIRVIEFAKRGKEVFEKLDFRVNTLNARIMLAKAYHEMHQEAESEKECQSIIQTAKKENSYAHLKEAYGILSNIEKKRGNYLIALKHFENYQLWNDSLVELKRIEEYKNTEFKRILLEREMDIKYATEKKELENLKLKTQNKLLKRNVVIAGIGTLILGILSTLLYKTIQSKNKLNDELKKEKKIVEEQVKEKITLIQEVHHRVKNNLTMINSLLYLQSKEIKSEEAKRVLTDFQSRIRSIAIVHNKLYEESNLHLIEFNSFIQSIFNELLQTYSSSQIPTIHLKISGHSSPMEINMAITLGLITNELLTNSLKYAFHLLTEGIIDVNVLENDTTLTITYSDNGPGLKNGFESDNGSFGFKLLHLLPKQINGQISYNVLNGKGVFTLACKK